MLARQIKLKLENIWIWYCSQDAALETDQGLFRLSRDFSNCYSSILPSDSVLLIHQKPSSAVEASAATEINQNELALISKKLRHVLCVPIDKSVKRVNSFDKITLSTAA